ncbi:hypothetical protein KBY96_15410 [Cyanobium sp. ATX 6A2]|uniref:hypothetical protein n=1 Tax=Cyanobium sp. ATX 6A2 TaxID=2823700 RepID=UPI0020CDED38|nr:hypothetical protein [Cyanobium sp. ATX 6A2]MCP9889305.1 hypothetical protein [Cyanobium sp. ATX 6A2]
MPKPFARVKDPYLRAWAERQSAEWREAWGDAHEDLIMRQRTDSAAADAIAATTPLPDGIPDDLSMEKYSEVLNRMAAESRAAEAAVEEQG